jgi:hypothetical protein
LDVGGSAFRDKKEFGSKAMKKLAIRFVEERTKWVDVKEVSGCWGVGKICAKFPKISDGLSEIVLH